MTPAKKTKSTKKTKTPAEVFAEEPLTNGADRETPAGTDGPHPSWNVPGQEGVDGVGALLHIGDLIPDPQNPRKHNPKNIGLISDSLRDVGAGRSIVIDESNEILAGNGLVEAAAEAGITKVQVVEADGNTIIAVRRTNLTPDQKRRLAIFDNRTAELAEWDVDVLRDFAAEGMDFQPFEFGAELTADIRGELPPPPPIRTQRDVVAVADLKPHPRNYRTHNDQQIAHITQSIRDYGVYRSVVIAQDNTILAGHGVVVAAKNLDIKVVPVIRLDLDPEDPRALKVLVGDNEMSFRADIDDRSLTEMLREVKDADGIGLEGTGYDAQQLAALAFVTRPATEIGDIDEAAHWVGMPEHDGTKAIVYEVLVRCTTEEDRASLLKHLKAEGNNMRVQGTKTAVWWPLRNRQHQGQFVNQDEA